jgi:hypothetical protein
VSHRTLVVNVGAVGIVVLSSACSNAPHTILSPSTVPVAAESALNLDGSSLKVTSPTDLAPDNAVVGFRRPTLTFTNPSGHVAFGLAYDIEIQNADGALVYARTIGESPGTSSHTIDVPLPRGATFWWRVRGRLGDDVGPWSGFAVFHIAGDASDAAGPPPASDGPLPFAVPAECGPFGPGDRTACVVAMTAVSPWWPDCQAGSGTNCHRFTRSVAAALEVHDANWGLISKNPGEQQCHWDFCGPGDGSGYGEDIVAYHTGNGNWIGWDTVAGAGAPGASAQWSEVGGRRAGNDWRPVPPFP